MLIGCYYRCPIVVEEGDNDYPRFFVLAQIVEYNELAEAVKVEMHDLLGSGMYYQEIFRQSVFDVQSVARCSAAVDSVVEGPWGRGTVTARAAEPFGENEPYWYWVNLSDGRYIKVCETELRIEYSQMSYQPEKQLRAYEFQNPSWFISRLKVSRNQHLVNNAIYGFRILAGCRAYLLPHQISTVARCMETMPVRYMLADEVGLGKTVEACSILRILASENVELRSLIIVPGALISQWRNELHYKYGLEVTMASPAAKLCLLAMEDMETAQAVMDAKWDMSIVDETHRLLGNASWYRKIEELSRKTNHLLLLSATPIQERNEEYRRLLALLNPDRYGAMSAEHFSWMVSKQKRIQKSVNQQLGRLERYEEYSEIIYDKLTDIAQTLEDKALNKLTAAIDLQAEDRGLEKVKQALAYVCENYRVERRVIRNRRQLLSERLASRALFSLPYTPLSTDENYNEMGAIQGALSYLSEKGQRSEAYIINCAIPLLAAVFSSPWAFEEALSVLQIEDSALSRSAADWRRQAENEHALVNEALDEDPELIKGRLMTAVNYIDQETSLADNPLCKLVVFTAFNATLVAFLALFNAYYERRGVQAVAFGRHMSRSALEDSVYAFQNDPNCRVIVCDETGGEGRNFQMAAQVIHLDLPWSANALEQRIGRLDRLGRNPKLEVLSVVLYAEGSIEQQLFRIWRDGLKLFEQSLSGLEIITGELNSLIFRALEEDYHTGLENAFEDILEQAEEMRESVEDEQDFDLGVALYRPLAAGVDDVLSLYAEEDNNLFASSMMAWASQAGLHGERISADLLEFRESSFSIRSARQSLLVPPDWECYSKASIMLRERKILGSFDRGVAALREDVLFFAPGDPLYNAIISNAMGCSRGRCTAVGTVGDFDYMGLIFIYSFSPELDGLLESGLGLHTLSQYRMYLPLEQITVTMPLNAPSRNVAEKDVLQVLEGLDYCNVEHMGKRSSGRLKLSPLERFIMSCPTETWEPLVDKCAAGALRIATDKMCKRTSLSRAKQEMRRVLNGYRAECLFFGRDTQIVDEKKRVFEETYKAMELAKPVLEAVCLLRVKRNG